MRRTTLLTIVNAGLLLGLGCSSSRGRPTPVAAPTTSKPAPSTGLTVAEVDRVLEETWRAAKVTPAPLSDDGEFLRRVTLDLVGRVPTLPEAKAFLSDTAADKRARLVDRLLASSELAEHWADIYGDLFWGFEGSRNVDKRYSDPRGWLVTALNQKVPYDRLVWELLTATGDVKQNGALAFLASRGGNGMGAESVAAASARLFLGLQIQCAQCHDHPYDQRWKQQDFYGLVAYFSRTRAKRENTMEGKSYVVFDAPRGRARMRRPGTDKDVVVEPKFLGQSIAPTGDESLRQTFARAVIQSDLFPKTMVARTWAHLFGRGLMDPWDDLGAEKDPSHPALLVKLADDFRARGFDFRQLLRTIVLSTAYQRSSAPAPGVADDGGAAVRAFARAAVRPLRPEQLFRTLVRATGVDQMARARRGDEAVDRLMAAGLRGYKFVFDDDEMLETDTFNGSMPQALLLMNGELTNNGARVTQEGVLGNILKAARTPAERLDDMFLAVYARRPTAEERAFFQEPLGQGNPRQGYEDVFFALLTSTEAITNH